jgi:hypothetical protein
MFGFLEFKNKHNLKEIDSLNIYEESEIFCP